jgi:hypothetical protein
MIEPYPYYGLEKNQRIPPKSTVLFKQKLVENDRTIPILWFGEKSENSLAILKARKIFGIFKFFKILSINIATV